MTDEVESATETPHPTSLALGHLLLKEKVFHPVGKSYASIVDDEKLYFYCREKPSFGRDAVKQPFTFDFEYDIVKMEV